MYDEAVGLIVPFIQNYCMESKSVTSKLPKSDNSDSSHINSSHLQFFKKGSVTLHWNEQVITNKTVGFNKPYIIFQISKKKHTL